MEKNEPIKGRLLSEYNLEKISHAIKKIDYSFIDWDLIIDTKWLFMKNKITKSDKIRVHMFLFGRHFFHSMCSMGYYTLSKLSSIQSSRQCYFYLRIQLIFVQLLLYNFTRPYGELKFCGAVVTFLSVADDVLSLNCT